MQAAAHGSPALIAALQQHTCNSHSTLFSKYSATPALLLPPPLLLPTLLLVLGEMVSSSTSTRFFSVWMINELTAAVVAVVAAARPPAPEAAAAAVAGFKVLLLLLLPPMLLWPGISGAAASSTCTKGHGSSTSATAPQPTYPQAEPHNLKKSDCKTCQTDMQRITSCSGHGQTHVLA